MSKKLRLVVFFNFSIFGYFYIAHFIPWLQEGLRFGDFNLHFITGCFVALIPLLYLVFIMYVVEFFNKRSPVALVINKKNKRVFKKISQH